MPSQAEIDAARRVLADLIPRTRLVDAPSLATASGAPIRLKLEAELPTGSFKVRGALFALSRHRAERGESIEVVASSTGNHGAAVAYAASAAGVPATIFLPRSPNPVKRARIAERGARIIEAGADLAGAAAAAAEYVRAHDAVYLDDVTDPYVPAGTASIACEILEQAPDTEAIVVPIGDTALIRGVAAVARALKPRIRIIGVQARTAPAYYLSWRTGEVVPTETCDTVADGLATRTPHAPNVAAIRDLVDDIVLVSDDEMVRAVRHLLLVEHVVAEPAGAAATAAALGPCALDGPTALLVTGANLTPALLRRVAALDD
ncbi:MAG TPA: pyridoxal-phosphate dependent enzyme [Longimicrobiales bacterium]